MVKNPPANAGDAGVMGSIPGSGRSLGGGNDKPSQYSCLKYPMDRGTWQAIVHRVAKSWAQLIEKLQKLQYHTVSLSHNWGAVDQPIHR